MDGSGGEERGRKYCGKLVMLSGSGRCQELLLSFSSSFLGSFDTLSVLSEALSLVSPFMQVRSHPLPGYAWSHLSLRDQQCTCYAGCLSPSGSPLGLHPN